MPNIQFAAMSLGWGNPAAEDLSTFFAEVKTAGYDGVAGFADGTWEMYLDHPDDFARQLNDHGLSLASLDVKFIEISTPIVKPALSWPNSIANTSSVWVV